MEDVDIIYKNDITLNSIETFLWNLSFPGIIFHELAHVIAALITLTPIIGIKFLTWDKKSGTFWGHVQIRNPNSFQALLIGIAPFLLVSLLGIEFLSLTKQSQGIMAIVFGYFAYASIKATFPSIQDVKFIFYRLNISVQKPTFFLLQVLKYILLIPFFIVGLFWAILVSIRRTIPLTEEIYFVLLLYWFNFI